MPTGPICGGCPNQPHGERFIQADGDGSSGILFLGDSPWRDEMAANRNFSGAAGHLYEGKWLKWLGLDRRAVTTANSMWCKPPKLGWTDNANRTPDAYASLQHCRPYLDQLVEERKPRVIVPMGNVALGRACGISGIEKAQGYVHESVWGIPAVPTFHPSYVLQGKQKLSPMILVALKRAQRIANGTYEPSQYQLILDPTPSDLRTYLDLFPVDLGDVDIDIETPESADLDEDDIDLDVEAEEDELPGETRDSSFNIIRAGFALEPGVAVSFPYEWPYIDILAEVMGRATTCWEWTNRHFDSVRLTKAGLKARRWASGMWMWHFYKSDLPKALGFVAPLVHNGPPWKQLSSESPAYYNGMDHVIQNAIRRYTEERLRAEGRWEAFWRHCVETDEILVQMTRPGFLIDKAEQDRFREKVEARYVADVDALQSMVPAQARNLHPKNGYKKPPKAGAVPPLGVLGSKAKELPPVIRDTLLSHVHLVEQDGHMGWLKPFNPHSSQQVVALIKALRLPVPMNHREQKATTEAKHLKKLVHKHPAFRTLLDCRESNKMLTTYIWGGPEEAHESPDGPKTCIRIWTHYGFNPSTWRKNSYQVNSQNIPKRSDLAQQFRRMIVAAPGHQFVAFDSSAIEAVLVGYFAGSARYIRLAKMGVHDWVTSVKVGQPIPLDLPDEELRARCKAIKKAFPVEREMIKRVVHLSNYKGTPGRIFEEYPEHFRNEKEAKDLQDLYFNTDPGKDVVRWQNATLTLAHKEHVLKTPVGYWHEFYNVFTYDKKYGKWRLGDDAKRCIAFKPQGTASGIQTEVLLWVAEHHPWLVALLRLIIHDEIAAEVPDAQVPDAVAVLQQGFTQAWPQLGGLSIGAEGKVGRNLAEWSPDNPDGLRGI